MSLSLGGESSSYHGQAYSVSRRKRNASPTGGPPPKKMTPTLAEDAASPPAITSTAPSRKAPLTASAMDLPHHPFTTIKDLHGYIEAHTEALSKGREKNQYHVVRTVPPADFARIDDDGLPGARFQYDDETGDMIIKLIPGLKHEATHMELLHVIRFRITEMGLDDAILSTAATTYEGRSSRKQGDSGVKPLPQRQREDDWPTLVVECGLTESATQLRRDANWWLENSEGQVRIVILIMVTLGQAEGGLRFEKWQRVQPREPPPSTRARSIHGSRVPEATASVTVEWDASKGGFSASDQLTIDFEDVFLRSPVPPEHDLVLARHDLERIARKVSSGPQ